jgi:hypothetical protein
LNHRMAVRIDKMSETAPLVIWMSRFTQFPS